MRALLATVAIALAAVAPPSARAAGETFEVHVDALVRDGYERPQAALAPLRQMLAHARAGDERRVLLQAVGGVEAMAGRARQAGAVADELAALAQHDASGRVLAASQLVRAQIAENAARMDVAAALAQSALPAFRAGCPGGAAASALPCGWRSAWRTLQVLERHAISMGIPVTEEQHATAALALARFGNDATRQAISLSALALLAQGRGDADAAKRLLAQARHASQQSADPMQAARYDNADARLAMMTGDFARGVRRLEDARREAAEANAPRLEARMLINLSDVYTRLKRPADALAAAERALPIVRRHADARAERLLINNAGIAKIGLGRVAEGKRDLARLLDLWRSSGEPGRQAETLLEFGEALAAAGDARSAIELYHRERAMTAELMKTNRAVALKELQTRNDAQARQRDIELLERDNALKTEALAIRDLRARMWWLIAALMVLATLVLALLLRRVRETNRRLAASHAQLQAQSERDPLTNLANRRHFQAVMARLAAAEGGFQGALLLVDIDHFKRINDVHGHAAGDQVLVEVARRLDAAVRGDDLVVRWGGEEFLILAPRAATEQVEQMAERLLRSLGEKPIGIGGGVIAVTASVGYGRFPLPPHDTPVPWEQAVNLADMALYLAKSQGRNRAVGIVSTTAAGADALRQVEADFDRAWHEGRVELRVSAGPATTETSKPARRQAAAA